MKKCPQCGLIYGLSDEYCELNHCPYCGSNCVRTPQQNVHKFLTYVFLCTIFVVLLTLDGVYFHPRPSMEIYGTWAVYAIVILILFYFCDVGRYRCEECGKRFSSPVTHIRLVESSKRCPFCGAELPITAKFCGYCGKELEQI